MNVLKKAKLFLISHLSSLISEKGQALVTLLFFTVIGLTVTSAAVVMMLVNSNAGTRLQEGEVAYQVAQSGAEEALIRFIRDPNYTGTSQPLLIGSGSAQIQRTGTGPYVFTSTGTVGSFVRKVQFTVEYQNNLVVVTDRHESF